jgi:hypothetical protein
MGKCVASSSQSGFRCCPISFKGEWRFGEVFRRLAEGQKTKGTVLGQDERTAGASSGRTELAGKICILKILPTDDFATTGKKGQSASGIFAA